MLCRQANLTSLVRRRVWRPTVRALFMLILAASHVFLQGCASLTNPVRNGMSVEQLAHELRAISTEEFVMVPLSLLGQPPMKEYRVGPGDLLGIWVDGIPGEKNQNPPLPQLPDKDLPGSLPPGVGTPVPVQENGAIQLPLIGKVVVEGLTLAKIHTELVDAYTVKRKILPPGKENIVVTLIRPRHHRVIVMREDSATGSTIAGSIGQTLVGLTTRGTGHVLNLAPSENDVLHALAQTGGLPGRDAYREVVIHRGQFAPQIKVARVESGVHNAEALANLRSGKGTERETSTRLATFGTPPIATLGTPQGICPDQAWIHCDHRVIRIPLALPPHAPIPFSPEDVILHSGDVVYLESRDRDVFYTGGLLPAGQHLLPRDFDLDVIEAVSRIGGPLVNGGVAVSNLSGAIIQPGIGNPSPKLVSIVRKDPGGNQVVINVDLHRALRDPNQRVILKAGDVVILQETPLQSLTRFVLQSINGSVGGRSGTVSGVGYLSSPPTPFTWPR